MLNGIKLINVADQKTKRVLKMGHFIDPVIYKQEFNALVKYLNTRDLVNGEALIILQDVINFRLAVNIRQFIKMQEG